MTTFTESRVREAGRLRANRVQKRADSILTEALTASAARYDVFLSHSIRDAEIVLGVKAILEGYDKSVYVDWIEDPRMDRSNVTKESAGKIRTRMQQCETLLYLHTENSPRSQWMPWELGYFDGHNGKVGIFPVTKTAQSAFVGQEYLSLYPYVDEDGIAIDGVDTGKKQLWSCRAINEYAGFDEWSNNPNSIRKRA